MTLFIDRFVWVLAACAVTLAAGLAVCDARAEAAAPAAGGVHLFILSGQSNMAGWQSVEKGSGRAALDCDSDQGARSRGVSRRYVAAKRNAGPDRKARLPAGLRVFSS